MPGKTASRLSEKQKTRIAEAMIDIINKHSMFCEVNIYVNGGVMKSEYTGGNPNAQTRTTSKGGTAYTFIPDTPYTDQYGNPDLITCTFEGPLYTAMNYDTDSKVEPELNHMLKSGRGYRTGRCTACLE